MMRITKISAACFIGAMGLLFFLDNLFNLQLAVGVLGLLGAARMILTRAGSAAEFEAAKALAVHAGVMGMLVWYGFFIVAGEAYFHMWQTETGLASVEGAFRYGTVCAVLMFFIRSKDD